MSSKTEAKIDALHERLTSQVIESILQGIADGANWKPSWHAGPDVWSPINPVTGRRYTAGNRFNLGMMSVLFGHGSHWATYDQWASLSTHTPDCLEARAKDKPGEYRKPNREDCERRGCDLVHVRKGEKATTALRPMLVKDRDTDTDKLIGFTPYSVFSSDQVEGYTQPLPVVIEHDEDDAAELERAFTYAATIGAEVIENDSEGASYYPGADQIVFPARHRWDNPTDAWAVLVHELIHWTGHESRLNRKGITEISVGRWDDTYAFEELIAELGAVFHLAHLGLSPVVRPDHMDYLAGWLKILKADANAIWQAATHAENASKMLGRLHTQALTKEDTHV